MCIRDRCFTVKAFGFAHCGSIHSSRALPLGRCRLRSTAPGCPQFQEAQESQLRGACIDVDLQLYHAVRSLMNVSHSSLLALHSFRRAAYHGREGIQVLLTRALRAGGYVRDNGRVTRCSSSVYVYGAPASCKDLEVCHYCKESELYHAVKLSLIHI